MLKTRVFFVSFLLAAFVLGTAFLPVQAAENTLPLTPEYWFQTSTLNLYSVDYSLNDYLIKSDGSLDTTFIAGLTAKKDDAKVNFANGVTVIESDSYFDSNIISSTFLNNTFNAGTATSASVITEFATASKSTIGTGVAKSTGAGGNVIWKSQNSWDANGDGDYADPTDKNYYPLIDSSATLFFNGRYHINETDATAYGEIGFTFATTGSDYTIRVRYWYTSGDSGWTDIDSSGENAATLNYYDVNYTSIAGFLPIAEILDADQGDTPDLSGLKESYVKVLGAAGSTKHTISVYNMAALTKKPALSDRDDDDTDFDIDASAIFSTFIWDDTDYLATKVTESTTESYDNTMPLSFNLETGFKPLVKFRKLQITGQFYAAPTKHTLNSVLSGSIFSTTMWMQFTTTGLNAFVGTATDYFSWTNVQFNITLSDTILPGTYQTFENQLSSFKVDGLEKEPTFDDSWDTTKDDVEIAYDSPDPNTLTGSQQEFIMVFNTRIAYSGSGGAGAPAQDNTLSLLITVVVVVIAGGGVILFAVKRKRDKGSIF